MNKEQIIRAWKDEEYRAGLNESERQLLPAHPAGIIEIPETEMDAVAAGVTFNFCTLVGVCGEWLFSVWWGGTCQNMTTGCCGDAAAA